MEKGGWNTLTINRDTDKHQVAKRYLGSVKDSRRRLATESMPFSGLLGTSATNPQFDKHMSLMSDRCLFYRCNAIQRDNIINQLQRTYGNAYVQRVRDFVRNKKARLGADFGNIRIYNDSDADKKTQADNSKAFSVGNDKTFKQGAFAPIRSIKRKLMGNALTHVIQQGISHSQPEVIRRARELRTIVGDPIEELAQILQDIPVEDDVWDRICQEPYG